MTWPNPGNASQGSIQLSDEKWTILAELADASEYWSKAHGFLLQHNGRELSSMTDRQVDWYYSIGAALDRELQMREAREVWGVDGEQAKRMFDELYPGRIHR